MFPKQVYNPSMTKETADLLKEVLSLPAEARAAFADRLLESLDDHEIEPGAYDEWRREIKRRMPPSSLRWNPDGEDVQRSVAQLVLTIVEFLRRLMERQAIRRMEQKTLTRKEAEAVGLALMKLEETVREIGARFGLTAEDLNLDLGSLKLI